MALSAIAPHLSPLLSPEQIVAFGDLSAMEQARLASAWQATDANPWIVYPHTQAELAAVVALAHQHRCRVLICGQGSKLGWGYPAPHIDLVISTQRLKRLIDHAIGDLTVTVEAGMPLAELQDYLAPHHQFLALDPAYAAHTTIGGLVATRDAGALRHRYGGVRDQVLGINFVRYDGQSVKAGGRVVKNVAGYDLMKLFSGSFGTLGILSEITLRLYPALATSATLVLGGEGKAIATLNHTLLNSTLTPTAVDLLTPQYLSDYDLQGDLGLAVRFQSVPESVTAQCERLQTLAAAHNVSAVRLNPEPDTPFWQQIHTQLWQPPGQSEETAVVAKFGGLMTAAPQLLLTFTQLAQQQGLTLTGRCHAGSGVGVLRLTGGAVTPDLVETLRSHTQTAQGFLTVLEAPPALKQAIDVWGYDGNALATMRQIKAQFDPDTLFNPGRFIHGL